MTLAVEHRGGGSSGQRASLPDDALVRLAQAGESEAFVDLYERHYLRLFHLCRQRLQDRHEAEDVTQEAFLKAWKAIHSLHGELLFYAWLRTIAINLCNDTLKRRGRVTSLGEVEPAEPTAEARSNEPTWFDASDVGILGIALDKLSDRHRAILRMREEAGWSYQRIAEHENLELNAVKALIWRARQALRREFTALANVDRRLAGVIGIGWSGLTGWSVRTLGMTRRHGVRLSDLSGMLASSGPGPAATAGATAAAVIVTISGPALAVHPVHRSEPSPSTVSAIAKEAPETSAVVAHLPSSHHRSFVLTRRKAPSGAGQRREIDPSLHPYGFEISSSLLVGDPVTSLQPSVPAAGTVPGGVGSDDGAGVTGSAPSDLGPSDPDASSATVPSEVAPSAPSGPEATTPADDEASAPSAQVGDGSAPSDSSTGTSTAGTSTLVPGATSGAGLFDTGAGSSSTGDSVTSSTVAPVSGVASSASTASSSSTSSSTTPEATSASSATIQLDVVTSTEGVAELTQLTTSTTSSQATALDPTASPDPTANPTSPASPESPANEVSGSATPEPPAS